VLTLQACHQDLCLCPDIVEVIDHFLPADCLCVGLGQGPANATSTAQWQNANCLAATPADPAPDIQNRVMPCCGCRMLPCTHCQHTRAMDKVQESGPAHNQEKLLLPQHASILIKARACCWFEACPPPVTTGASQLSIRCCPLKVRLPPLQSGHNVQAGVASCHVWEPCSSGGLEPLLARECLYPRLSKGQLL
jgi:hypothetical protein